MDYDPGNLSSELASGLPERVRWVIGGVSLDYDFSACRQGLRRLTADEVAECGGERDWSEFRVFGRYDYAEGGGATPWIVVRMTDGAVCGLDMEREDT